AHLCHAVGTARIKRRRLALRRFVHLSEHLAGAGLIEARLGRGLLHGFEHARHTESRELAGQYRLRPRGLYKTLRREIVDLVGLTFVHRVGERRLVEEIGGHELDPIDEMTDALIWRRRTAAHDAYHAIALVEQELREIGPVLSGNAGD